MKFKFILTGLMTLGIAMNCCGDPTTKTDRIAWYNKELSKKLIIIPEYIHYWGCKYAIDNLEKKERNARTIEWINHAATEEMFILKLKKIIKATDLKIPFYVSPEAGCTVIKYIRTCDHPITIGAPFDYLAVGDCFKTFEKFNIFFEVTDQGILFKQGNRQPQSLEPDPNNPLADGYRVEDEEN